MDPNRGYEALARAWVWRGGDEARLARGIAEAAIAHADLFRDDQLSQAHQILRDLEELGEPDREHDDGGWLDEAESLAEMALELVGMNGDGDHEAGWGDGFWLNEYSMLAVEEVAGLRAVLPAVGLLFEGHLIVWQDRSSGHPGPEMEVWQLGEAPYPRVRRYREEGE